MPLSPAPQNVQEARSRASRGASASLATASVWTAIDHPAEWDAGLRALPHAHVLQSWQWGEFKARWGWSAERWRLDDGDGAPVAMVQLLRRRVGPVSAWYAPKGPTAADAAAYEAALAFVERRARRSLAIWAKIDGDPLYTAPDANAYTATLERLRDSLQARGWRRSRRQVQFRNTLFTRLDRTDDELLAGMKEKWRYNVRLAARRGVTVRQATPADFGTLYDLYGETGRRDGFVIRTRAYYDDVWRSLNATAFIAERDGQALAGLVLLCFADRAWYFYGMSRTESREHMPTYALQWHAMRWARDAGYATYDWWGAPETADESDPMWGVYRWKQGFGARPIEGIGAWDFAPSPALAQLLARAMPGA